jgi:hypothetical protein
MNSGSAVGRRGIPILEGASDRKAPPISSGRCFCDIAGGATEDRAEELEYSVKAMLRMMHRVALGPVGLDAGRRRAKRPDVCERTD